MTLNGTQPMDTNLLDLLLGGGWAMVPLALASLLLFYLTFRCWQLVARPRFLGPGQASVLGQVLLRAKAADHPDEAASEALADEASRVESVLSYLSMIAAAAPMVGLLGTVSGMMGAFQVIGAGGMGQPERLAADIGEALITTAAGLAVGIPAMVAHGVLRNRLNERLRETARETQQRLQPGYSPSSISGVDPSASG